MRTLRTQLLISHLLLVLLMGVVMSLSIASLFKLSSSLNTLFDKSLEGVVAANQIRDLVGNEVNAATAVFNGRSNGVEAYDAAHVALTRQLDNGEQAALGSPRILELMHGIEAESRYIDLAFHDMASTKDPQLASNALGSIRVLQTRINVLAAAMAQSQNDETAQEQKKASRAALSSAWWSVLYTFAAVAAAVLLAARMMRIALTPLAMLAKQAEVIGSGDLDKKIQLDRKDEIGALAESFNEMASKLAELRNLEARRLRRAQKMTDSALESLYDPVIVADAKGRIVHLNRAAEKLFGPAPESPRMPIVEHIGDERILKAIKKAIEQQTVSASEDETSIVPLKVEGGDITYRLRATPMKEDDGTLLGSVVVLEDITGLKQLDRLKTEFIGVASHELRTPITSLLLSNELMAEGAAGELNDQQKQLVAAQEQDLQRLERLTRELLDLTRLEAGQSPPRFEMIPAQQISHGAIQSVKNQADEKGVRLIEEAFADLPEVRADRSQVTRVIINLLNNAIRHTPAGGTVTLRATPSPNQVTFDVADTGEGIPSEYLAKIFDRFVQVPGATQGGAGLGLSIAQRIVKAHGGVMQVGSELGKGSTFSFSLSTKPEDDGEEAT